MKVIAKPIVHDHVVDDRDHQALTAGREYIVIGISDDQFRVCDDAGEPILYPKALFEVVDDAIPPSWVTIRDSDGATYVNPPDLAGVGFYEDYFDDQPYAIEAFRSFIAKEHERKR